MDFASFLDRLSTCLSCLRGGLKKKKAMITHAIISVSDLRTPLKGPFINPFQETQPS